MEAGWAQCAEAEQVQCKIKTTWTDWLSYFIKINVMRTAIAKMLCTPVLEGLHDLAFSFFGLQRKH